jgi:O-antigen ligase
MGLTAGTMVAVLMSIAAVWLKPRAAAGILAADSILVEVIHAFRPTAVQYLPWLAAGLAVLVYAVVKGHRTGAANLTLGLLALLYAAWVVVVALIHWPSDRTYALGVPLALGVVFWAVPRVSATRRDGSAETIFRQLVAVTALSGALFAVTGGAAALVRHVGFLVPVGHHTLLAWQWPFADKNTLGYLEAWAVPAAAAMAAGLGAATRRPLWWGVFVLALIGLLFSYARTAWIAAVVGLLVLAVGHWRWRGAAGVALTLLVGAAALVKRDGVRRLAALWGHGLSGRAGLWRAAFRVGLHHWLFGVGPGNSPAALMAYVPPAFRGLTPSDAYLETWVELGAIGLLLFLAVVGTALSVALRRAPDRRMLWAWLALLAAGLTEQVAESAFLGGLSFEDYLFTALLGSVMVWQGLGLAERQRRWAPRKTARRKTRAWARRSKPFRSSRWSRRRRVERIGDRRRRLRGVRRIGRIGPPWVPASPVGPSPRPSTPNGPVC